MAPDFQKTVSGLVEAIVLDLDASPRDQDRRAVQATADFVREQAAAMQDYLRWPIRVATLVFDAWSLPLSGRTFHRLPIEQRRRQLARWRRSRLGFKRDLMTFYESLTIFSWYAERAEAEAGRANLSGGSAAG